MSVENVSTANGLTRQVETGSATATSSDTETVIATIDARGFASISISAKNAGANTVTLNVYGSNDSSFADENSQSTVMYRSVSLTTGLITLAYSGTQAATTVAPAIFAFYRIKIVNASLGSGHASSTTAYWCLKNT